jgi:hypothetical protein
MTMDEKTAALGDPIEIWCRYCRLNLDANVSAIKDGAIAKVQCRTCRHFQDYRPPVPASEQRQKLIRKAMKLAERRGGGPSRSAPARHAPAAESLSPEAVARAMWEEATKDADALRAKVYDTHRKYAEGDVILHKAHGMGVVREVRDEDSTILALFREGVQRLEHDRSVEDE